MVQRLFLSSIVSTLFAAQSAFGVTLDLTSRRRDLTNEHDFKRLKRDVVDPVGAFGNGSSSLSSFEDVQYLTNLTLGGVQFEVLIDTGSSDLFVVGEVPGAVNTTIESGVAFGVGLVTGYVNTSQLVLDDIVIENQVYLAASEVTDMPPNVEGLLGLGPSSASNNRFFVNSSAGDPPLDRIYQTDTSLPRILTVLLSRETDALPGGTPARAGQLSIGEVIPFYEGILNQTKLPGLVDQFGPTLQHWETLLDANGIIGPDGEKIETTTTIENATAGSVNQLHVVLDTGFSLPAVPRNVADAIYGRVPNASFVTQDSSPGVWTYPCSYELNVSFVFGGVHYPIHPLDLSVPAPDALTILELEGFANDSSLCVATFQEIGASIANHTSFGALDMVLGQAFLRNTYALFNFGNFVDGSDASVPDPYIQLLSITDPAQAHQDFVNVRLNGADTTGSQAPLVPKDQAPQSPEPSATSTSTSSADQATSTATGSNGLGRRCPTIECRKEDSLD